MEKVAEAPAWGLRLGDGFWASRCRTCRASRLFGVRTRISVTADAQLTGDLRGWRPPGSAQAREVKMWEAGF